MPSEIVKIVSAEHRFSNGDTQVVEQNAGGRYTWELRDPEGNVLASNPNAPGVWAAIVGAAEVHHPGRKAESARRRDPEDDLELEVLIGQFFTWAAPVGEEFGEYPTWDQLNERDQAYGLKKGGQVLAAIEGAGLEFVESQELALLREFWYWSECGMDAAALGPLEALREFYGQQAAQEEAS